jgi:hypothetical protein
MTSRVVSGRGLSRVSQLTHFPSTKTNKTAANKASATAHLHNDVTAATVGPIGHFRPLNELKSPRWDLTPFSKFPASFKFFKNKFEIRMRRATTFSADKTTGNKQTNETCP